MPWQELKSMDLKLLFIADYLRQVYTFTKLCQHANISRKTGYKWVARYQESGVEGLRELSRQPYNSPLKTPYAVRKEIISMRTQSRVILGPKKIQAKLKIRFPDVQIPSVTTIYNILCKEGLVPPKKQTPRVPACTRKKEPPTACHEQWSIDFKGQFSLITGEICFPLTVMDGYSRFLLGCQGLQSVATDSAKKSLIKIFKEHGLPKRILSDNGVPFAAKAAGGLSRLSVWWVRLGIVPERIQPGKPQQNGRHERMHRTLKEATVQPRANSMSAQQCRFNQFRQEYNYDRPHEALKQQTPSSLFTQSLREYPRVLPELEYPSYFNLYQVKKPGVVYALGGQIYISNLLQGETVGFEEVDDGCWDVYFGPIRLGNFDERDEGGNTITYWTLKR